MNRREILKTALAGLLAPFLPKPPLTLFGAPVVDSPDLTAVTEELLRCYPPGAFAEAVEKESVFARYLRGNLAAEIDLMTDDQMPRDEVHFLDRSGRVVGKITGLDVDEEPEPVWDPWEEE